jgi:hypothetical protein
MTSDRQDHVRPAGVRKRGPRSAAGKARAARNALKHGLVGRIVAALLGRHLADARTGDAHAAQEALGWGLMRDGNGPRALDTLVRYRGGGLAELFRSLAALQALRAQAREVPDAAPALLEFTGPRTKRIRETGGATMT